MTQPDWLIGREHRREGVAVDGDKAWALFCASADGDNTATRQLLAEDGNLIHAQIWYQKPIDLAMREGHVEVTQTILEADIEHRLAAHVYAGGHYTMGRDEVLRRGHRELDDYICTYRARLAPGYSRDFDAFRTSIADCELRDFEQAIAANRTLLSACDQQGNTALHHAIRQKRFEIVRALVDLGAPTDARNAYRASPMDFAAAGYPPAIAFLIARGVRPTIGAAVALGLTTEVRTMLLQKRGVANQLDPCGSAPLTYAARHRQRQIVEMLLEHGANPNLPERDAAHGAALFAATENWDCDIMRLLLDAGANPNAEIDSTGCPLSTLVDYEKWGNHPARRTAELLRDHGAGDPPWALSDAEQLELLKNGSDEAILAEYDSGWSEFHRHLHSVEALDLYVERFGAGRIATLVSDVETASLSDAGFVGRLIHHGLDLNRRDWQGRTLLHRAAWEGDLDLARLYLDRGAEIDPVDVGSSTTPLGYAAKHGRTEVVRFLLDRGADANVPSDRPWAKPRAYAELSGEAGVVDLLS